MIRDNGALRVDPFGGTFDKCLSLRGRVDTSHEGINQV